jgi:3-hydroxyacyl-[acyl-carrier-protein] dehydratase
MEVLFLLTEVNIFVKMIAATKYIIDQLPYRDPFLFVDEIADVNEDYITGSFHLRKDLDFYKGHFKEEPVTPGVILIEIMAQIGLACFGIFLSEKNNGQHQFPFALCATNVEFMKPVFPGETVTVESKKIFHRFGKLKCHVVMLNEAKEIVCEGTIAGIEMKRNKE